jgi:hypothetical protein
MVKDMDLNEEEKGKKIDPGRRCSLTNSCQPSWFRPRKAAPFQGRKEKRGAPGCLAVLKMAESSLMGPYQALRIVIQSMCHGT